MGTPFRAVSGEDDAERLAGLIALLDKIGGKNVDALPGEGILSSALRSQDEGDGVMGESMNGISTSSSSSQSSSESIESGMNGARSS